MRRKEKRMGEMCVFVRVCVCVFHTFVRAVFFTIKKVEDLGPLVLR